MGKVFPDYRDDRHCSEKAFPIVRGARYIGGWHFSPSNRGAFVLLQILPDTWQVQALLELSASERSEAFSERVMAATRKLLPGAWDEVEHLYRVDSTAKEWPPRYGAVAWLLADELEAGAPRLLVDGTRCPILREGFDGAYRFGSSGAENASAPARANGEKPVDDVYGCVQTAFQIAAVRAQELFQQRKTSRLGGRTALHSQSAKRRSH